LICRYRFNRRFEQGKVLLYGIPNYRIGNRVVIVPQDVTDACDTAPMDFRPGRLQVIRQSPCRLRYDFERALERKAKLPVALKIFKALPQNFRFDPTDRFQDIVDGVVDRTHQNTRIAERSIFCRSIG
jgi:hypothetical protein